jgi:hypothetical protein
MACQEAMEANPKKMEPNPGEREATVVINRSKKAVSLRS